MTKKLSLTHVITPESPRRKPFRVIGVDYNGNRIVQYMAGENPVKAIEEGVAHVVDGSVMNGEEPDKYEVKLPVALKLTDAQVKHLTDRLTIDPMVESVKFK